MNKSVQKDDQSSWLELIRLLEPEQSFPDCLNGMLDGSTILHPGKNLGSHPYVVGTHRPAIQTRQTEQSVATDEFVLIPAGQFSYGESLKMFTWEEPEYRTTTLPEYQISKQPITNLQYAVFAWETGHSLPAGWLEGQVQGQAQRPVVKVSWQDAQAFCTWLAGHMGQPVCLPTELQWEKAARSACGCVYFDAIHEWTADSWEPPFYTRYDGPNMAEITYLDQWVNSLRSICRYAVQCPGQRTRIIRDCLPFQQSARIVGFRVAIDPHLAERQVPVAVACNYCPPAAQCTPHRSMLSGHQIPAHCK